jgi:pimeloyl-ACP methyl ester carboxylesterase
MNGVCGPTGSNLPIWKRGADRPCFWFTDSRITLDPGATKYQRSSAGYRVIAPFLRGYPPTEIPAAGYYDRATLAIDLKELIVALNGGEPAFLVGQDSGAAIAYNVVAAFPELVRRAVVLAVPHPGQTRRALLSSPNYSPLVPLVVLPAFGTAGNCHRCK